MRVAKTESFTGAVGIMSDKPTTKTSTYEISMGRKSLLSLAVLIMTPFVLSAPILVGWRISRGQWADAITPTILTVAFIWAFSFIIMHMISAMRTKIEIDDKAISLVIPTWRGPTPAPPYRNEKLSFAEIDGVETRAEIYRAAGVLIMMRSYAVRAGDKRVVLGYMKDHETDPAFPLDDIAKEVAARSNVPISNLGLISAGSQYGALYHGEPSAKAKQVDERSLVKIEKRNEQVLHGMVLAILALAFLGLGIDLVQSGYISFEMPSLPGSTDTPGTGSE